MCVYKHTYIYLAGKCTGFQPQNKTLSQREDLVI